MSDALIALTPGWAIPPRVRACFTTRAGGVSMSPWAGLNLATHVGDDPSAVLHNRALLAQTLDLPAEPHWLEQVHGTRIVRAAALTGTPQADAAITRLPGVVCTVLVADCLPLLLCSCDGLEVAAVHAGWRGLAGGVIAKAVAAFAAPAARLLAWIGPAIGASAYTVGADLRARFVATDPGSAAAFSAGADGWRMDLAALAAHQLAQAGVSAITRADTCVYGDPERFYSYRRDRVTGRMAALIWLATA